MRTVELNNVKYEYTYKSDDLYDVIALMTGGDVFNAAKRCTKLLKNVEDNETNGALRFKLGPLILADIDQNVMVNVAAAKNSPSPSGVAEPRAGGPSSS